MPPHEPPPRQLPVIRLAYRWYRAAKQRILLGRPPVITPLFFLAVAVAERLLASRRDTAHRREENRTWRTAYLARYRGRSARPFRLRTAHPVATETDDHRHPRGTIRDNSRNARFNRRLDEVLGSRGAYSLLDLGCAGGGLVRSVLEDGHEAVGLEGSDISRRERSGDWATIPYHLFTCNIVKPFRVLRANGRPARFTVVTAWEVLEHIPERDLGQLIRNIKAHLEPGGLFICSIDQMPDGNPLKGAVYHQTLRPAAWWKRVFRAHGLVPWTGHPFRTEDMVRGNGLTLNDWDPADGGGFHLVLRRA